MALVDENRYDTDIGARTTFQTARDFCRALLFGQNLHYSNAVPRSILATADAVMLSGRELQRLADAMDRVADAQERIADAAELPPGGGGP